MATSNPTPPPSKPPPSKPTSAKPSSSSLSSHFAMIELKQRILTSISKLSDRDTHHIALSDLQSTVSSAAPESVPMLLNCLYDAASDPAAKPPVRKDALSLLALLAASRPDPVAAHLPRIVSSVVRRLKDSDSAVRDACRDAIGAFSAQYLRNGSSGEGGENSAAVSIFVKPLFEALNEQSKVVQSGAALCLAKVVECAHDPPVAAFQKLCPRISKYLNNPNFLAKASLLSVVSSLSQVGAIAPQNLPILMQGIHECLENTDWATRKAAADTLSSLASHSAHLVAEGASSTISALEACRFDKVKPVRDSMTEALQLWKKIAGKGEDGIVEDRKASHVSNDPEAGSSVKLEIHRLSASESKLISSPKDATSLTSDLQMKAKGSSISDKTVGILKKKAPSLTDKELNPDFFQKLETRGSGDLPVEVVVPRGSVHSSQTQAAEEAEQNCADSKGRSNCNGTSQNEFAVNNYNAERTSGVSSRLQDMDGYSQDNKSLEQRVFKGRDLKSKGLDVDEGGDINPRDLGGIRLNLSKMDGQSDGSFVNHKGNWLAIQRQLALLERQQVNIMNMLQDFMGGSHDSMVTLENRVRGLERVVEDMARDLSLSQGRRATNFMMGYEGPSARPLSKYNGLSDYSSGKFGRGGDGMRLPFGERLLSSDGIVSGLRGREPSWRSDVPESWDSYGYGSLRNIISTTRKGVNGSSDDVRLSKYEQDGDQAGTRRAWDKGVGPVRLGEGPSARSVWQASKDEATLEAIRVAGEDNGTSRTGPRVAVPELEAECVGDGNANKERGPLWVSWSSAMDSLHAGDVDSAYAELLSTGDDVLLMKLMDRTGPVLDQLSNEIASEILHIVGQYLLDQNLLDVALSWVQQLTELVMENGAEFLAIPVEIKRELLMSLHDASGIDLSEDWEGATAEQLMIQLASTWRIDLEELGK